EGEGEGEGEPDVQLVFYDPLGPQNSPESNPLPASSVGAGLSATALSNVTHGYSAGSNTDVRPTLMTVGPLDTATTFYVSLTLSAAPGFELDLSRLNYTYRGYSTGTGTISVRSSADAFAQTVAEQPWTGSHNATLSFDLSALAQTTGPVELRLYMHDLATTRECGGGAPERCEWADLVSTASNGDGLRVWGRVAPQ
ncbi:MAG: hypothetical protein IT382_11525, partial [Deltaproteobacteria bacterium]|nr:hypothetical protein [Deltaproteobacteria bacterium]